jgi:predicted kinase
VPTLFITRGLPGSGKSTRALAWVAEDPTGRARVNRDDLRTMLHGGRLATAAQERQVTAVRDTTVTALLQRGVDVVCDDTGLRQRFARELRRLAALSGAGFEVWDLTDVPLEECLRRNELRAGTPAFVPEDRIREMWARFVAPLKGRPMPLPDDPAEALAELVPYVPVDGRPAAVLVAIDGTAALMGGRSPYDETRVHEDLPNTSVITAVRAMHAAGHAIVFCSGRTETSRPATEAWLGTHVGVPYAGLYMRAAGDQRKDSIVKRELFDTYIREVWNVAFVLDDRQSVVAMWRALGLTAFAVAEGNF